MDTVQRSRAVLLFSGGLDSTTLLSIARSRGFDVVALLFRYGQRHAVEVDHAVVLARSLGVDYRIQDIDLRGIGGSALTAESIDVPRDRTDAQISSGAIPPTYVPARNTIFLALALGYAEARDAKEIWIGVNALDYSGYPDCRPEFIEAFQNVIWKGTRSGVEHHEPRLIAPLLHMTKADIIRRGVTLGVDYAITHSCYDPTSDGRACGHCDSCLLRRKGFLDAGVGDPTVYTSDER